MGSLAAPLAGRPRWHCRRFSINVPPGSLNAGRSGGQRFDPCRAHHTTYRTSFHSPAGQCRILDAGFLPQSYFSSRWPGGDGVGFHLGLTAEALAAWIDGLGLWAPVGFVALYAVATVALVPGGIFDLVGGALFVPISAARSISWAVRSAPLCPSWSRATSRAIGPKFAPDPAAGYHAQCRRGGLALCRLRALVPVIPYNIANYLLGVTRIPFPRYVLATLVFMAPSTVAYTWIGHASRQAIAGDTENIKYALIALALIALVLLVPRFYKRLKNG